LKNESDEQPAAPSTKVKIAASAGGVVAGAGAALGSLLGKDQTRKDARRLGVRLGKMIARTLGEPPRH